MYDRVLFPTDGSETASAVFDYVLAVASTHDATVHGLHVADTTDVSDTRSGADVVDVLEQEGEDMVDEIATRAEEAGVSVVTDVHRGDPAGKIVEYADEHDIDLLVMPTHGRSGLERYLLGSVTERVVNTASSPVLTVTPSEGDEFVYPPQNLLLPTDGSRCARVALDQAVDIADVTDAMLHLLTVVETTTLGIDVRSTIVRDELEERATEILDSATEAAEGASVDAVTRSLAYGRPYREIHSYITDNDIDLVVLGTHGETDFSRYVLGGVSARLIRTSPVPVMLVPERGTDE
ncbi:MAG: universal stress protein [Halovenus sp.]